MRRHRRTRVPTVTAIVVGLVVVLALGFVARASFGSAPQDPAVDARSASSPTSSPTSSPMSPSPSPMPTASPGGRVVEIAGARAARPVEVRIPSVGISSRLDPLPVLPDGTLAPPPRWQVAGWYDGGPRPGEIGPAVIAGHVDSPDGPAVFANLAALEPGDLVEVEGADQSITVFRVDRLEDTPKDTFPTEAVYGQTPDRQLRLITCSGPYDRTLGSYLGNLIVFATQVSS